MDLVALSGCGLRQRRAEAFDRPAEPRGEGRCIARSCPYRRTGETYKALCLRIRDGERIPELLDALVWIFRVPIDLPHTTIT